MAQKADEVPSVSPATKVPARSRRQEKLLKKQLLNPTTKPTNYAPFRTAERKYKNHTYKDHVEDIIDIRSEASRIAHGLVEYSLPVPLDEDLFGRPGSGAAAPKAYSVPEIPGLLLLPDVFAPAAQRAVVKNCVVECPRSPNLSNLHTHYQVPPEGIWALVEKESRLRREKCLDDDSDFTSWIPPRLAKDDSNVDDSDRVSDKRIEGQAQSTSSNAGATDSTSKDSTRNNHRNRPPTDHRARNPTLLESMDVTEKPAPPASSTVPSLSPSALFKKLRWVTLGYQYHWGTKSYHFDKRFPFPNLIASISKNIARAVEGIAGNHYSGDTYTPEAGVVNYYQHKDTLMAHVDKSEINASAPLISISLGNACIFLIGSECRDDEPIAVHLRSGDVLVMTGYSRGCFHGVPRILEGTLPDYLSVADEEAASDPAWANIGDYIATARINVNVRQVF